MFVRKMPLNHNQPSSPSTRPWACRWRTTNVCDTNLDSSPTVHSVARQCIHCCKGGTASQWDMAILGVRTP